MIKNTVRNYNTFVNSDKEAANNSLIDFPLNLAKIDKYKCSKVKLI